MATADPQAAVAIPRHRFTVEDFARLGEAGIASATVAGLRVTVDEIVGRVDSPRL